MILHIGRAFFLAPPARLAASGGGAGPEPPRPDPRGPFAALIGLPAAAALLAAIAGFEGYAPEPYDDPVGILTVCWGDTEDVERGRTFSRRECERRLERQALAHAAPVLACVPQLRGRDGPLVAAASLAYNIGAPASAGRPRRGAFAPATGGAAATPSSPGTRPACKGGWFGCAASPTAAAPNAGSAWPGCCREAPAMQKSRAADAKSSPP